MSWRGKSSSWSSGRVEGHAGQVEGRREEPGCARSTSPGWGRATGRSGQRARRVYGPLPQHGRCCPSRSTSRSRVPPRDALISSATTRSTSSARITPPRETLCEAERVTSTARRPLGRPHRSQEARAKAELTAGASLQLGQSPFGGEVPHDWLARSTRIPKRCWPRFRARRRKAACRRRHRTATEARGQK